MNNYAGLRTTEQERQYFKNTGVYPGLGDSDCRRMCLDIDTLLTRVSGLEARIHDLENNEASGVQCYCGTDSPTCFACGECFRCCICTSRHLNDIKAKCEQYWNDRDVNDAEFHAVLDAIHRSCVGAHTEFSELKSERDTLADANQRYCADIAELSEGK